MVWTGFTPGVQAPRTPPQWIGGSPPTPAWPAAWAARATTPATWLALGDSITEGQGASIFTNSWVQKCAVGLRAIPGSPSPTGGVGWAPVASLTTGPDSAWTSPTSPVAATTGTAASGYFWQTLDGKAGTTNALNDTFTWTAQSTSFQTSVIDSTAAGTYQVDALTPVALTNGGNYPTLRQQNTTPVTSGTHTLQIKQTNSGIIGVDGVFVFNGDESNGLHVWNTGHFGALTSDLLNDWGTGDAESLLAPFWQTIAPDVVTFAFGANEFFNNISPATFKTNVRRVLNILRGLPKLPSIYLLAVPVYDDGGTFTFRWTAYQAALSELASEYSSSVYYVDLMETTGVPTVGGLFSSDRIHPNDSGHALIASRMTEVLGSVINLAIVDDAGSSDSYGPGEISGLAFWLNAETIKQSNGTAVASWVDQSSAGLTVSQGTGSAQPTLITSGLNGRDVVRFDGGDALTNASSAAVTSGEFTAFVVAKETSAVNGWAIFNGNGNGYALGLNGAGTNRELLLRGQADVVGTAYTPSTAEIWEGDRTATGPLSTLRKNGTSDATSSAGFSAPSGGLVVGAYETAAASFFIGDIGEIILYSRQLTASERARVTRYLSNRWGITATEGESHVALDKTLTVNRTDDAGSTDSATMVSAFAQNQVDSAGASDSAALSQGWGRSTTDDAGSVDSAALVASYARSNTDSAGSSDAATTSVGFALAIVDDAGSVDSSATARGYGLVPLDSAGSTDVPAPVAAYVQSRADDSGTSDTAVIAAGRAAATSDETGSTDAVALAVARALSITDDSGVSDAPNVVLSSSGAVNPNDNAGTSDSLTLDRALALTDTAGSTDSAVIGLARVAATTDSVGTSDSLTLDRILSQIDSAGSTDSVALALQRVLALVDDIGSVDSIATGHGYAVSATDDGGVSDTAHADSGRAVPLVDTAGSTDSVTFVLTRDLSIVDSAGSSDLVTLVDTLHVSQIDSAGVTDVASVVLQHAGRNVTVTVAVGERRWSATMPRERSIEIGVGERRWSVEAGVQDG